MNNCWVVVLLMVVAVTSEEPIKHSEWSEEQTQNWLTKSGLGYSESASWKEVTGADLVSNTIAVKLNVSNPIHIAKLEAYSHLYRGICPCNIEYGVQSLTETAWLTPSPHTVYFFLANTRMFFLYTFFTTYTPTWSDSENLSAVFSPSFKPANYSTSIAKESEDDVSQYSGVLYFAISMGVPYLVAVWHVFAFYSINPLLFLCYLIGALIETTDEAIRLFDLVTSLLALPSSEVTNGLKDVLLLSADCAIHWGFDILITVVLYFVQGYLPYIVQTLCVVVILGLHTWGVVLLL